MEVSCQYHIPAALLTGKNPKPIERKSGWAPEPAWTCVEDKNIRLWKTMSKDTNVLSGIFNLKKKKGMESHENPTYCSQNSNTIQECYTFG
jgi:hypothetical protein